MNTALREITVYFANGNSMNTSMAAHLTDAEIMKYYAIGKVFNMGSGGADELTTVTKVDILN